MICARPARCIRNNKNCQAVPISCPCKLHQPVPFLQLFVYFLTLPKCGPAQKHQKHKPLCTLTHPRLCVASSEVLQCISSKSKSGPGWSNSHSHDSAYHHHTVPLPSTCWNLLNNFAWKEVHVWDTTNIQQRRHPSCPSQCDSVKWQSLPLGWQSVTVYH